MKKSNANQYTIYGAAFGILFPLLATYLYSLQMRVSFLESQTHGNYLLLIIDTAPFFLGLFARFAGVRQDKIEQINSQLEDKISERTEELGFLKDKYELILQSTTEGIIGIENTGIVTFANEASCKILGFEKSVLMQANFFDEIQCLFPGMNPETEGECPIMRVIKERKATTSPNVKLELKDGHQIEVDLSVSPMIAVENQDSGAVIIFNDQTEMSAMRNEMMLNFRLAAIGELAAGVAHEINNPLAIIKASAEIVQDTVETDPDIAVKWVFKQMEPIERIQKITAALRLMSQAKVDHEGKVSVHEVIENIQLLIDAHFRHSGIVFETKLTSSEDTIIGTPAGLQTILMHFLNNAKDAMEHVSEGRATIATKKLGRFIQIEISDTGRGIPKEIQDKIFMPFFSSKNDGLGTGLGLGVSISIIQDFGGTVSFESEESKGATFWIEFPLVHA